MALRTDIAGSNRSGAHRSPEMLEEMIAATAEFPPSSRGDARAIAEARAERARRAEPFATMPPPTSVGQLAKNTLRVVSGQRPFVLLDAFGRAAMNVERVAELIPRVDALYRQLVYEPEVRSIEPDGLVVCVLVRRAPRRFEIVRPCLCRFARALPVVAERHRQLRSAREKRETTAVAIP